MMLADIAAALLRTTLATSFAALIAWGLLAALRVKSPRVHRVAWLLAIAQGWLLFPFTIEVESTALSPPEQAAGLVPAVIAEQASIAYENGPEWSRELFATSNSLIAENAQSPSVFDPAPLAIAAWLLGAIALVVIGAHRYLRVLCTLPLGSPADDPQWLAEWEAAQRHAALRGRHAVELRITAALGPLIHWAPWVYFILVPRPLWSSLERAERSAILRHELAHLRRHDLWKSLAIRIFALPQWFNPLARLAVRRFDEAAEWACDDAAARSADDRLAFANSLLQSAEYALAPYPASAPAARGVLTRRIHRLVSPRFKEESKMKLLLVPLLLLLLAMFQTIRIERVVAEEAPQWPTFRNWSLAEEFSIPLAERLENTKRRHAQLLAERQRHFDAAKDSTRAAAQDGPHAGPPASVEQMEFDRLAKEYENFARMDYVIEPPDILSIEGVKLVPKAPHRLETFDLLRISAKGSLPEQPIDGDYNVDADGAVDLGPAYGRIEVVGKTFDEAEDAVRAQLSKVLADSNVSVSLRAASSAQTIAGQHLVAMDGRVDLGNYGSVFVAGMTRKEARAAIELKLAEQFDAPEVSVDVLAYNSKVYYVITKGGRLGDDVTRVPIPFPVDCKENVAQALARIYDNADRRLKLKELADASVTLVRRAPNGVGDGRIYPVMWDSSTQAPTPLTNYGILPGDRIIVKLKREGSPATGVPKQSVSSPAQVAPPSEHKEAAIEALPNEAAELSIKRVGNSLLLVREPANERASGESSENAVQKLKISPRWLEGHRCLQPYDTLKLRIARLHRPAYALTWEDVVTERTLSCDGSITLNNEQGAAQIGGMTVEEARAAIERQLRKTIPNCTVQLELGSLASQKFFVSIQRPDGTEIAAGALPTDSSMPASFQLGGLRSWLGNVGEASWELAEPSASHANWAYLPKPGDRLVIKVPVDFDPRTSRPLPRSANDTARTKKAVARPFWIEVIGNVQAEPPQSQLPSDRRNDLGFVIEPRFLPNVRRHAAAP